MREGPAAAGDGTAAAGVRRRFVTSTVIDAVGSGLWMPFALLFLVHGRGLALVEAGAALTTGGLIGLASVPLVGAVIDRFGPMRMLVISNVVRFGCFLYYPLVTTGWQVVAVSAIAGVGDRLFWTANGPLVNAMAGGREADRLIGTQTIARFSGAGMGAAAAAVLPALAGSSMFDLLAIGNAVSFAVAALLLIGVRAPRSHNADRPSSAGRNSQRGWLCLLRHRAYVAFCATHVVYALASVSKFAVLPLVVFDVLRGPEWLPGTAILIGTAVIVLGQRPVLAYFSRWDRSTSLVVGSLLFSLSFASLATLTMVSVLTATVVVLAFSVVVSLAEAIFAPPAIATAAAAAPPHLEGRASALFQLSWGVAHVLAPVVLTGLLAVDNAVLWAVMSLLCLATVPAVLRLRIRMPAGSLT